VRFTDTGLRKLKPRDTRYDVTCTGRKGLQLRVFPTGNKVFYYRYQLDGRVRRLKLGDLAEENGAGGITLAEAFRIHATASEQVNRGEHATGLHGDIRAANLAADSIETLIDKFCTLGKPAKRKNHEEVRRALEKDLLPEWKDRKARSITQRDVSDLLDRVAARAPMMANALRRHLIAMFRFGIPRGMCDSNPAAGTEPPGGREKPRQRWLTEDEIAQFWHAIPRGNSEPPTQLAIKILIATGQRRSELVNAKWAHIQFGERHPYWMIPAENSKNDLPHVVPLPALALELFRKLRDLTGSSEWVLPSYYRTRSTRPIAPETLSGAIEDVRELVAVPHFTLHDCRRTMRTHVASLGIEDKIAERLLNHKPPRIIGVYNCYEYLAEKRHALTLWNEYLAEIIRPKGVTHDGDSGEGESEAA
jgi:integrase